MNRIQVGSLVYISRNNKLQLVKILLIDYLNKTFLMFVVWKDPLSDEWLEKGVGFDEVIG
jgi:hypothetical protein